MSWPEITVIKTDNIIVFQVVICPVQLNPVNENLPLKEGNIQVCAALNGIVKIIKAQSFCVFFVKEVIVVKLHDIAGKFASLRGRFSFTGFS